MCSSISAEPDGRHDELPAEADLTARDWRICVAVGGTDARKELMDSFAPEPSQGRGARSSTSISPGGHPPIRRSSAQAQERGDKTMSYTHFVLNARRWLCVGVLAVAAGVYGPARDVLAQAPAEAKQPAPSAAELTQLAGVI